jgi:hypothetical protein
LKNKKRKKKNHVGKHHRNSQYFKGKKLQSEIFNQLNIKKVKSTKIILKKKKQKTGESWKKKKESNFGKKRGKFEKKQKSEKKKKEKGMHCGLLL